MTTGVLTQLAIALTWMTVGVVGTLVTQMVLRERAKAAADNARVEREFAPTLARCRPVIAAARHVRPSWLPAARDRWAGVRKRLDAVRARLNPIPESDSASAPPPYRPVDQVARDVNDSAWPVVNAAHRPAVAAVGRAEVTVDPGLMDRDFTAWVRRTNELLHQRTDRAVGRADTALLPVVPKETADAAVV